MGIPNGYSAHFVNASSQSFSVVDSADLKPTGNYTVGAWFKTSANFQEWIFASYNTSGGDQGISLDNHNTTGNMRLLHSHSGSVDSITTPQGFSDGFWHWLVGVYDGSKLYLYVDGRSAALPVSVASAATYNATNIVRVGCFINDSVFWDGNIDEVFLLNGTAWTAAQVASFYGKTITDTNLKAYWRMENSTADSSGNSHTLANNVGAPTFQTDVPFTGATTNYLKKYNASTGGRLSFG